jgi:hypothetical protein
MHYQFFLSFHDVLDYKLSAQVGIGTRLLMQVLFSRTWPLRYVDTKNDYNWKNAITSPANGLMVFDTTLKGTNQ